MPVSHRPLRGYRHQLNISNFRTLFVYRSEARMEHAMEINERVIGPNNYSLFGWMSYTEPSTMPDFYNYQWQTVGNKPTTLTQ